MHFSPANDIRVANAVCVSCDTETMSTKPDVFGGSSSEIVPNRLYRLCSHAADHRRGGLIAPRAHQADVVVPPAHVAGPREIRALRSLGARRDGAGPHGCRPGWMAQREVASNATPRCHGLEEGRCEDTARKPDSDPGFVIEFGTADRDVVPPLDDEIEATIADNAPIRLSGEDWPGRKPLCEWQRWASKRDENSVKLGIRGPCKGG